MAIEPNKLPAETVVYRPSPKEHVILLEQEVARLRAALLRLEPTDRHQGRCRIRPPHPEKPWHDFTGVPWCAPCIVHAVLTDGPAADG